MGERIAVAMSGGVDSSVAAWLLQREGHELMGVTLRLFDRETPEGTCGASDDLADARAVAERLGMPHQVLDCRTCFRERVIRPFAAAYEAGCTPNPCVDCNRGIKFGELLRRSLELGAEAVATGHYVRMERDGATGRCLLKKALHPEKDQSSVLYSLTRSSCPAADSPWGGCPRRRSGPLPHGRASATRRRKRARISASSQTGIMPLSSAGTWGGSTLRGPSWIRTAGVWVPMRGSSPIRWASAGDWGSPRRGGCM